MAGYEQDGWTDAKLKFIGDWALQFCCAAVGIHGICQVSIPHMKATISFLIALSCSAIAQGFAGESPTNQVLRLDGKTGYMAVADSPSLHWLSNAMTLELRFQAASFYQDDGAVNSLLRKNVKAEAENFFLRFRILNRKPMVEFTPGNNIGSVRAPYDFKPGTWYHLSATYDGTNVRVLVDGAPIKSAALSGTMRIDESELVIGKGDPEFSSGSILTGRWMRSASGLWRVRRERSRRA